MPWTEQRSQSQSRSNNSSNFRPQHHMTNVDLQSRAWIPRDQVPDGPAAIIVPPDERRPSTPPRSPTPSAIQLTKGPSRSRRPVSEENARRHADSRDSLGERETGGLQELQKVEIDRGVIGEKRTPPESRIVPGKTESENLEKPHTAARERRSKWGPPIHDVQEPFRVVDKLPSPGEALYSRISSSYDGLPRVANGLERGTSDDRNHSQGSRPPVGNSERQAANNQQLEGKTASSTVRDSPTYSKRLGKEFEDRRGVDVGENRVLTEQRPRPSRGNSLLERLSAPERSITFGTDDRLPTSSGLSLRERLAHAGSEKQDSKAVSFDSVAEVESNDGIAELSDKQDDPSQLRNRSGNRSRGGRNRRSRGKSSYSSRA